MGDTMNLKTSVEQILSGKLTFDELTAFVNKGNAFERINGIKQISKQFPSEKSIAALEAAAQDDKNGIALLGRTIKAIAIGSLVSMNRDDATESARRMIKRLSANEVQDLDFHLQSEGLRMP